MGKVLGCLVALLMIQLQAGSVAAQSSFKNVAGGIWSTGLSPTPVVLTPSTGGTLAAQVDTHYALIKIPAGCSGAHCQETSTAGDVYGPNAYVVLGPNGTYPLDGTWTVLNNANSSWIGPRADQRDPIVGNPDYDNAEVFGSDTDFYVYRTTFNLTALGLDHATAAINLSWLSDNDANAQRTLFSHIRLCSISSPTDPVCPANTAVPNSGNAGQFAPDLTTVNITSGFKPGLMALDFIVYNEFLPAGHNASGLNVLINSATSGSLPLLNVTLGGTGTGTVSSDLAGIACPTDCAQGYLAGTQVTLTATATGNSIFTGWLGGSCSGTSTTCTVTVNGDVNVTATFAAAGTVATLDVDASAPVGTYNALTDGLLIIRWMFGLTGNALISNAVSPGAQRATATAIADYLTNIKPKLDADGNGSVDALTDGLLIIRRLFGLSGTALTNNAIGPGATRNAAEIETYLQGLMP